MRPYATSVCGLVFLVPLTLLLALRILIVCVCVCARARANARVRWRVRFKAAYTSGVCVLRPHTPVLKASHTSS